MAIRRFSASASRTLVLALILLAAMLAPAPNTAALLAIEAVRTTRAGLLALAVGGLALAAAFAAVLGGVVLDAVLLPDLAGVLANFLLLFLATGAVGLAGALCAGAAKASANTALPKDKESDRRECTGTSGECGAAALCHSVRHGRSTMARV